MQNNHRREKQRSAGTFEQRRTYITYAIVPDKEEVPGSSLGRLTQPSDRPRRFWSIYPWDAVLSISGPMPEGSEETSEAPEEALEQEGEGNPTTAEASIVLLICLDYNAS